MIPILYLYSIINKKEQAINFVPEIFKPKKFLKTKGTRNESMPENYFFHFYNTQAHSKIYDHSMYT